MFTLFSILTAVSFGLLVAVAGIRVKATQSSLYELDRRIKNGDKKAKSTLRRARLLRSCQSLVRIVTMLLLVTFVLFSIATFGWLLGTIIAVIGALEYGVIAKSQFVYKIVQPSYDKLEPQLLTFIERYPTVMQLLQVVPREPSGDHRLESRDELLHLVAKSEGILTADDKKLIKNGLTFSDMVVEDFMTPRSVIESVKSDEVLGPLSLDTLHKTGYSRFPVIENDIDHVVGTLYIHNLVTLRDKNSHQAKDIMSTPVYYIHHQQTLQHALAAFLHTHHHLFIVVNEYRETVGLLTLEDTLEALLGRKIVDEFDAHEDLRVVAERNPRRNNHPPKQRNV